MNYANTTTLAITKQMKNTSKNKHKMKTKQTRNRQKVKRKSIKQNCTKKKQQRLFENFVNNESVTEIHFYSTQPAFLKIFNQIQVFFDSSARLKSSNMR